MPNFRRFAKLLGKYEPEVYPGTDLAKGAPI